jgi:Tfp pilus assembly protein PilX
MRNRFIPRLLARPAQNSERGVALITALILLMLLSAMATTMYLSLNSDTLVNGYYRHFRGSFYAADSGVNIVRQQIYNQLAALVPATFVATAQPIPTGSEAAVKAAINNQYGSYQTLTSGTSWKAKFKVNLDTLALAPAPNDCITLSDDKTSTCAAPKGNVTGYQYQYNYHMTANGQTTGTQKATVEETGSITIKAMLAPAADSKLSFAAWGMFINNSTPCPADGSYLVAGTISGPVFTNGGWTFSDNGSYHFTDTVGSANANAGYDFTKSSGSPCNLSTGASATLKKNGPTISPIFDVPPKWGQKQMDVPTNDFNQQQAVLDGKGMGPGGTPILQAPGTAALNAALRDAKGKPYPTNGSATGVYLPYTVDNTASPPAYSFNGGGIYVEGNANVVLSTNGSSQQVYSITDANGKLTTITVDNAANTTTMTTNGNTVNISGVPAQYDPNSGNKVGNATLLYVDGNINKLTGPGSGQAAIQDGTALTITAANDVTITGDVLYKTEPVTLTKDQVVSDATAPCCTGTPAGTLIPGHDKGQALGIFTSGGNINLNTTDPNLEVDASLAAIGRHSATSNKGGLINTGGNISNLTIVGGRIQDNIMNIGAQTRNVMFDRRFGQGGTTPPFFPSTTVSNDGKDSATLSAQFSRTQWLSQSSY